MTLKLYIGSASEIEARLAGAPSAATTSVTAVTSTTVFEVASATSFAVGDSIVIRKQRRVISDISGTTITVSTAFAPSAQVGDTMRHYDADYTVYRDALSTPLTINNDLKTGGGTGDILQQTLIVFDHDDLMPIVTPGLRATIFEAEEPSEPLFAGVVIATQRNLSAKHSSGNHAIAYTLDVRGYLFEANSLGIEEAPQTNVNAGEYLERLVSKYTLCDVGEIDTTNSPTIDYIRLSSYRRFGDVGTDLSAIWPSSEFYVDNSHTTGVVYYRKREKEYTSFTLSDSFIESRGPNNVRLSFNHDKVFNVVRFPFYKLQTREPDFFVQSTVADSAFLRTSVVLSGQPANVEETTLLYEDFSDSALGDDWLEYDIDNPSPPSGHSTSEGHLIQGSLNSVIGLHFLNGSSLTPAAQIGDIGRVTDPAVTEPFTGAERQLLYLREVVVNTVGDCLLTGISDQTSRSTTTKASSTVSRIYVNDVSIFGVGDRVDIGGAHKAFVSTIGADYIDLDRNITAPAEGVEVTLHALAFSRIKFGILLKANGDLKYVKDGVETAFSTPRTYAEATYSFRIFMQSFESVVATAVDDSSCELADATNFSIGDVIDLYTSGSYDKTPERRVIAGKTGSTIAFPATDTAITEGYRVRTLPKIVVQVKGGAYGSITGREWTTIHTESNTWQTSADEERDEMAVVMGLNASADGTISLMFLKDPVGITGNIGGRYLHIGTQEVESGELDVDCLVRKLGSHYQLDFFPDTKTLWASGQTLELRYDERFRYDLIEHDSDSLRRMAASRGITLTGTENEEELIRLGGRVMDSFQIAEAPLSLIDASNQARSLLEAVLNAEVSLEIYTNSFIDTIPKPGWFIPSSLSGVDELEVKVVTLTEIPGAKDENDKQVFEMKIVAGSVDRLNEVLLTRQVENAQRVVIDDGLNDDTYTRVGKVSVSDYATASDAFTVSTCESPTTVIYNGTSYTELGCLRIA